MKIYLSKYWKNQEIFAFVLTAIITLCFIVYCILNFESAEDLILVFCGIWFIAAFGTLLLMSLPLVNYIIIDNGNSKITMYSFFGKELSSIDINRECEVYYEVISLRESTMSFNDYMILSNYAFPHYSDNKERGLSVICKKVFASNNQIIVSKAVGNEILKLHDRSSK